jgi:hypothetical protein
MECTLYKWSCPACRYDVCLSCFPHASYPKNGQFPFDYEEQLSAADSDPTPRRGTARAGRSEPYAAMMAGVTVTPTPDLNARTSVQRTICLMGSNESSYCKVRMEPSVQSAEISRVSHGSVIDVLDRPNCDFFQLVNNHGFVKKQPGRSAYWKRLSQDRYSHHEEDCAVEVCDTVELGAPCKPSAGSASEDQGIAQTPTSAALQAVERIIQYDNEQKARFASFAGAEGSDASKVVVLQDAQMSVLEAARTLFAMVSQRHKVLPNLCFAYFFYLCALRYCRTRSHWARLWCPGRTASRTPRTTSSSPPSAFPYSRLRCTTRMVPLVSRWTCSTA